MSLDMNIDNYFGEADVCLDDASEPTTSPVAEEAPWSAATRLLETAAATAERLVLDARAEAEALLADARNEADRVAEASRQEAAEVAARLVQDRETQAAELEAERESALAGLAEERAALEGAVAALEDAEKDQRERMRAHLTHHLSLLDGDEAAPVVELVV